MATSLQDAKRSLFKHSDALLARVLQGLRKNPKQIAPIWFYDEHGSSLFERICELPEYYLTRTELEIMHKHVGDIGRVIGSHAAVIELGSGTSQKTRSLLERLDDPVAYVPVDISHAHLVEAAGNIARDFPGIEVQPICTDFTQPFALPKLVDKAERSIVYFPGSTLGNFEWSDAEKLLRHMRELAGQRGGILLGLDLKKDVRTLEHAYNDDEGVTAQFNLNALRHLNRELGTTFDLDGFCHKAIWVEEHSRIEMHLVSACNQEVQVGRQWVHFEPDEHLVTEYSHKYDLDVFAKRIKPLGLRIEHVWTDPQKYFGILFLTPAQ